MKPEEKLKLREELVNLYEGYVRDSSSSEIRSRAQKLFFNYIYDNSITDREFMAAIHGLEHIGWEFSRGLKSTTGNWKMREDEAKEILAKLKV